MRHIRIFTGLLAPLALVLLAGCAKPIYKPTANTIHATPSMVAQAPENYAGASVIWGGRIVAVNNLADHTEIQLLAYPLNRSQQPQPGDHANGRFIAIIPGYLEPLNYPPGKLMTVAGHLQGTRSGEVGQAAYVFPLVDASQYHLWTTEELRSPWSNIHFGIGVGARL